MGRAAEGLVVLIEADVAVCLCVFVCVCVCYWPERGLTQFTDTEPERKTHTAVEMSCSLLIRSIQNYKTPRERTLWHQEFNSRRKMFAPKLLFYIILTGNCIATSKMFSHRKGCWYMQKHPTFFITNILLLRNLIFLIYACQFQWMRKLALFSTIAHGFHIRLIKILWHVSTLCSS